jgi:hypothetical protein
MRKSPYYLWAWAALMTASVFGLPRFFSLIPEVFAPAMGVDSIKNVVAIVVLLFHLPFVLVLILGLIFRPRKPAFTKGGMLGGVVGVLGVLAAGLSVMSMKELPYEVNICFTDTQGKPVEGLKVKVRKQVEGLTKTTSRDASESFVSADGYVRVKKTREEILRITTQKEGFAYTEVEVNPRISPYPVGKLQKIDIQWYIDPQRSSTRETSTYGSKNWDFEKGTLSVPVIPAVPPLARPIDEYKDSDWREVVAIRP